MRTLLLAIVVLAACEGPSANDAGTDSGPLEGPFEPGISGGPLTNRLHVMAVDELTGEPVEAAITIHAPGNEAVTGASPLVQESAQPLDRAIVTAESAGGTIVRWVGVRGARVVIPMPRGEAPRRVSVDVRGAPRGASAVELTTLAPLHIIRGDGVGGSIGTCEPLDACRVTLDVPEGAAAFVASALDAAGVPIGFAIVDVEQDAIDFDAVSRAVFSIDAPLPAPGAGLDAVVGVPGLAGGDALALLPHASGSTFVVPALEGEASWWILARAEGADRSSTAVQRGLREPADAGEWPAFLAPPDLEDASGALTATAPAGATLLVVERLGAATDETTLYLDASSAAEVDAPQAGERVVVRSIDAGPVDPSALDLDAIEAATVRWSEAVRVGAEP